MGTQTTNTIDIGDLTISVIRKNIKNVHLRVYPPSGDVRISAPLRMNLDTIRVFALSKLDWISHQQQRLRSQVCATSPEYIDGEHHYLWGQPYQLNLVELDQSQSLELPPIGGVAVEYPQGQEHRILIQIHPGTDLATRSAMMDEFYRDQIEVALPPLIRKWERSMGVQVTSFSVRKMKTKWGSCTPSLQTIRFNLELAKRSPECLEYVVVHELVHLLEPSHNQRFITLMDSFMPKWKLYQSELNRLPI